MPYQAQSFQSCDLLLPLASPTRNGKTSVLTKGAPTLLCLYTEQRKGGTGKCEGAGLEPATFGTVDMRPNHYVNYHSV